MNEANSQQNSSNFLDINKILAVLRKRKKTIIISTLVCAFLMLFMSVFVISPKYSSSTDILVNRKVDNQVNAQAQLQADVQMISTYKDIITSPTILNAVSTQLKNQGFNMTPANIKSCISISNQQNSQVFTVAVKAKNPQLAAAIANTTANVFKVKVKKIMSVNNVSILSKAEENPKPVSPKVVLNTLIGLIVGCVLGLFLAFIFDSMDRTITDESFITEELELNDLGIINEIPANKVKRMISSKRIASRGTRKRRV
ncbi:YveK family protein [Ligilactobacillus aviarius]|uniref:YveK family protein n=1 Tax=Ligilactobacillus aviarius TaxID=1606 RepID=UPI00249E4B0D|nr:Wzz/FepE/Etk N-terminal domain-containing protein [Ligilactobacillus aviarius]